MKAFYVYIMTNKPRGTLYIGMTSNIARRVFEHHEGLVPGFTKKYNLKKLVYAEACTCAEEASIREKSLKRWDRAWKIALIEQANPTWADLYEKILG